MSTSYYRLRHPVTYLRAEESGAHVHLSVWVAHGLAGVLVMSPKELKAVVQFFVDYEDDDKCPLRTHWSGSVGSVVTVNDKTLPDEACVVSEYGDLLTVGEVKGRSGARRADGMPTELFGYEVTKP